MNFLFEFLKNLPSPERTKLSAITYRGTTGMVWKILNKQATKGVFDKPAILKHTGIAPAHFDKITSEVLSKSYRVLFNDDTVALLNFLSNNLVYVKLFYYELNRTVKSLSAHGDNKQQAMLCRQCFTIIHGNLPILYHRPKASEKLAQSYVSLFNGRQKEEAKLYVGCILIQEKMEVVFAAAKIKKNEARFKRMLDAMGQPQLWHSEETVFTYYWTVIYFYHALEKFSDGLAVARRALVALKKMGSPKSNLLRVELRISEFLYYMSHFDEAYTNFNKAINSPAMHTLPDCPYHTTKYIQLCLITGNLQQAGNIITARIEAKGAKLDQLLIARDAVSYAKYFLFKDDYEQAFKFIQLGFKKNPKAKYLQYEIELRHLQSAYFALSGRHDVAIEVCAKNIKYLRNHGYGITQSDYAHFYVLMKAIFEKNATGKFSLKHQEMLDHHQQGSYAVYGRLLLKMIK